MTHDIVFLFDVDNTLLDNDQVTADLRHHLEANFGADSAGPGGLSWPWGTCATESVESETIKAEATIPKRSVVGRGGILRIGAAEGIGSRNAYNPAPT